MRIETPALFHVLFFVGSVKSPEALSDDFTAVGNHHESGGLMGFQVIPKLYGLVSFHDRENNKLFTVGIAALSAENGGASVQRAVNIVTDRLRSVTDNGKIFT